MFFILFLVSICDPTFESHKWYRRTVDWNSNFVLLRFLIPSSAAVVQPFCTLINIVLSSTNMLQICQQADTIQVQTSLRPLNWILWWQLSDLDSLFMPDILTWFVVVYFSFTWFVHLWQFSCLNLSANVLPPSSVTPAMTCCHCQLCCLHSLFLSAQCYLLLHMHCCMQHCLSAMRSEFIFPNIPVLWLVCLYFQYCIMLLCWCNFALCPALWSAL